MLAELEEIISYKDHADEPERQATQRMTWSKRYVIAFLSGTVAYSQFGRVSTGCRSLAKDLAGSIAGVESQRGYGHLDRIRRPVSRF